MKNEQLGDQAETGFIDTLNTSTDEQVLINAMLLLTRKQIKAWQEVKVDLETEPTDIDFDFSDQLQL